MLMIMISDDLFNSKIRCQIDNICVNHVMYADAICLASPSPAALENDNDNDNEMILLT